MFAVLIIKLVENLYKKRIRMYIVWYNELKNPNFSPRYFENVFLISFYVNSQRLGNDFVSL